MIKVERDLALCELLNEDVDSFMESNFGEKSCVSFMFSFIFVLKVYIPF
uniref:Uncharacterized protein n=1 Tax=Arundo donax TaxID=35708 RepID=A0A0A8XWC7_ARUDO